MPAVTNHDNVLYCFVRVQPVRCVVPFCFRCERAAKADTSVWTSTGGRTTWQNFKWVSRGAQRR